MMNVKAIREALGLKQEKFAQRIGVSFATVNRWENGKAKPSPLAKEKLSRLAKQADLTLAE